MFPVSPVPTLVVVVASARQFHGEKTAVVARVPAGRESPEKGTGADYSARGRAHLRKRSRGGVQRGKGGGVMANWIIRWMKKASGVAQERDKSPVRSSLSSRADIRADFLESEKKREGREGEMDNVAITTRGESAPSAFSRKYLPRRS